MLSLAALCAAVPRFALAAEAEESAADGKAPADEATVPPESAPAETADARKSVPGGKRAGPWAMLGGAFLVVQSRLAASMRLEGGLPLKLEILPGLAIVLPVFFAYQRTVVAGFGFNIEFRVVSLALMPAAQYEFVLPVKVPGRLSAGAEVGIGPAFSWIRVPEEPYVPAHWDFRGVGAARVAGWLRFGLDMGLVFAVQPVGVLFQIVKPRSPCGMITASTQVVVNFEFGIAAGYRFP